MAAILFPVFSQAKAAAKKAACLSNLRQLGTGLELYLADADDRLPDRRDLKSALPGGYRPWTSWPPSDPRSGWAAVILNPYLKNQEMWSCPSLVGTPLGETVQVAQITGVQNGVAGYWMWRFDRNGSTVDLDNLWGKTVDQAISDLRMANNAQVGMPDGSADVELAVDPYFPRTIPSVLVNLRGLTPHAGGRNRLFLDLHAKWIRDIRTNP